MEEKNNVMNVEEVEIAEETRKKWYQSKVAKVGAAVVLGLVALIGAAVALGSSDSEDSDDEDNGIDMISLGDDEEEN